ncbi:erythrocyte membrane protein 1, EMP1 [Plasmodium reichenowi]|uniref:Erythrocyte membrane protein 1, EMP1 n=1 Tax=Plasmodium reichenowi TaxID=5854 RepID=A0A060RRF1_PLARE|nr:erythrocyte membrane protein 1, EMP1 [Plasmodium reichenowi]
MAPPPQRASVPRYDESRNAKDLLDMIGQTIHAKVHSEALTRSNNKLKGTLSEAKFENAPQDKQTPSGPCDLDHRYHTTVTEGHNRENPCANTSYIRFSDVRGGDCDNSKIRGNNNKNGGACAPYRRLSLCDHNLENISDYEHINNHTLLADVCLAANFEGDSLRKHHGQHQLLNTDFHTNICTELARSFADIGDIVRGRDLYRGDNGKDKLEKNLKTIFGKIHENLGSKEKKNYDDDDKNYYQLRADWWEANRQEVWKALTCHAGGGTYFRKTCSNNKTDTDNKCHCVNGDPPTYFDYVPQYLRWFEEWAEDFCRKKDKKLKDLKKNCRGPNGNKRYCSGDGYNCEKTIRGIGIYAIGGDCPKCSVWCGRYKNWIANQKQEFIKQKKKCESEIQGERRKKRSTKYNVYEGYDRTFYEILTSQHVGGLHKFLELLNKEKECENMDEKGGKIDFNENHDDKSSNNNKTFYHSEYCDECPECGVKKVNGQFQNKDKKGGECDVKKRYKIKDDAKSTDIDVLSFSDERDQIKNKIGQFCDKLNSGSKELYEEWKCYKEKDIQKLEEGEDEDNDEDDLIGSGGLCILQKKNDEKVEKQKTFNDFFYFWIGRFLNDSMYWRGKVGGCLKNGKKTCGNQKCKVNCECFLKWIEKKRTEWKNIRKHFDTQDDLRQDIGGKDPAIILEAVLRLDELFENIKAGYGDAKELKGIKEMLEKEKKINKEEAQIAGASDGKDNTTIDKLLKHEEDEATKCKNCQPKEVKNPCSGNTSGGSNKKYDVVAHKVAHGMHVAAQTQLDNSSSRDALKGHIKNEIFNEGGTVKKITNVCDITEEYSNNDRGIPTEGPCKNKGKGFKIGDIWKTEPDLDIKDTYLFLPPRREHFCTSNLEKLNVDSGTKNANDNFLVQVLLAANKQADWIKKKYKENNNKENLDDPEDKETVCRAVRRSFADIGDIIKGTDLWDKNDGEKKTQTALKNIFGTLHESLDGVKNKYKNTDGKHTKLRADWWEANRDQVWEAMQCKTSGMNCDSDTPYDDYIPQRLRWMTEWAEWFCKAQSEEYGKLMGACDNCKVQGCRSGDRDCDKCKQACGEYKNKIDTWRKQWTQMQMKYEPLYLQAKTNAGIARRTSFVGVDYQQMFDFLVQLHTASVAAIGKGVDSATKSPYETIAGYIHQELPITGCLEQKHFCENENGLNSHSGTKVTTNEKYAFKKPPPQYKDACECKPKTASDLGRSLDRLEPGKEVESEHDSDEDENLDEPEVEEVVEESEEEKTNEVVEETVSQVDPRVCNIVNDILTGGKLDDACKQKYGGNNSRLGWKCIPSTGNGSTATCEGVGQDAILQRQRREATPSGKDTGGICIPPRRRKLYVGKLTQWADGVLKSQSQGSDGGESQVSGNPLGNAASSTSSHTNATQLLRQAFIESAAVETFFLWDRYKKEWESQNTTSTLGMAPGVGGYGSDSSPGLFGNNNKEMRATRLGELGAETSSLVGQTQQLQTLSPLLNSSDSSLRTPQLLTPPSSDTSSFGLDHLVGKSGIHGSLPTSVTLDSNHPETLLSSGVIPPDFLRQMFYTLGDYRDILVGDTTANGALSKEEQSKMETIKEEIDKIIPKNSDNQPQSRETPVQSSDTPSSWWQKNGPHIWRGMICALTYEDNDPDTQAIKADGKKTLQRNNEVYKKFFGDENKGQPDSKTSGTYEKNYKYENVTLDNNGDTDGAKPHGDSSHASGSDSTINNPKLKNFVLRSPFFRYLEEWGTEFCGTRAHLLKDVKKACRETSSGNDTLCSGDGHDCTDTGNLAHMNMLANPNLLINMLANPNCPGCYEQCRKYRKWIDLKFAEFHEQKGKYEEERQKLTKDKSSGAGSDDNTWCKEIEKKNSAANFLESLKHCKNSEGDGEKKSSDPENKINFEKPETTFGPLEYCKTCPPNIVNCNSGGRRKSGCTPVNGNEWQSVFEGINENGGKSSTIEVEMIDRRGPFIKEYLNNLEQSKKSEKLDESQNSVDSLFKHSYLFKSVRNQEWTCTFKDKDTDICKLTNFDPQIDLNEYTTFKVFLIYWLEDFLYGYYLLKKRKLIEKCTQNGGKLCDGDSKNACVCVGKWVDKKKQEWEDIKKHFKNRKEKEGDDDMKSSVQMVFGSLLPRMHLTNNKGKISDLNDFLKSYACKCTDNSENDTQQDIIQCLLEDLQQKISDCKNKHGQPGQPCDSTSSPSGENSTFDEDIDPDDIDTPIEKPGVCKDIVEETKVPESKPPIENILSTCPPDNNTCNNYRNNKNIGCRRKQYHTDLNHWTNTFIKYDKSNGTHMNHGIFVPPRRRQLCFTNIRPVYRRINSEQKFREYFLADAYNEAKQLSGYYDKDSEKVLEAMKYSFADYGDIFKGTDMLDDGVSKKIKNIFEQKINKQTHSSSLSSSSEQNITSTNWWEQNKKQVWYAMLCGYKDTKLEKGDCALPDEETDQFLRWLLEWGKLVCKEKKKRKKALEMQCECSGATGKSGYEIINTDNCKYQLQEYIRWNTFIKKSLDLLNIKYENVIKPLNGSAKPSELTVEEYIETGIKIGECNLFDIHEIHDIYTNKEINSHKEILKRLCPDLDFTYDITENTDTSEVTHTDEDTDKTKPDTTAADENEAPNERERQPEPVPQPHPRKPEDNLPPPPLPPPQADQPLDPTILQTTIPFGIALALGSIAFLFIKVIYIHICGIYICVGVVYMYFVCSVYIYLY